MLPMSASISMSAVCWPLNVLDVYLQIPSVGMQMIHEEAPIDR